MTLKLTARVMTEDGVKYTCHCDWESGMFIRIDLMNSCEQPEDPVGCPVSLSCVVGMVSNPTSQVSLPY